MRFASLLFVFSDIWPRAAKGGGDLRWSRAGLWRGGGVEATTEMVLKQQSSAFIRASLPRTEFSM